MSFRFRTHHLAVWFTFGSRSSAESPDHPLFRGFPRSQASGSTAVVFDRFGPGRIGVQNGSVEMEVVENHSFWTVLDRVQFLGQVLDPKNDVLNSKAPTFTLLSLSTQV